MQEAFLRIWERWDRVGALDDPTGYLYRTALNLYRKRLRRAKVALRRAVGTLPPRDGFKDVDERDEVVRALGRLTERQRTSVVLVDLHPALRYARATNHMMMRFSSLLHRFSPLTGGRTTPSVGCQTSDRWTGSRIYGSRRSTRKDRARS